MSLLPLPPDQGSHPHWMLRAGNKRKFPSNNDVDKMSDKINKKVDEDFYFTFVIKYQPKLIYRSNFFSISSIHPYRIEKDLGS